jgi:hypothetical protein
VEQSKRRPSNDVEQRGYACHRIDEKGRDFDQTQSRAGLGWWRPMKHGEEGSGSKAEGRGPKGVPWIDPGISDSSPVRPVHHTGQ